MTTFYSIILDSDMPESLTDEVRQRVERGFSQHYRVADNVIVVVGGKDIEDVIDKAGLGADDPPMGPEQTPAGVVFSLNGQYGGYFKKDFWKWLKGLSTSDEPAAVAHEA